MSTSALSRSAAAGGIALINSLGNLGGFAGPFAVGWIKNRTHTYQYPLLCLAGSALAGSLIALSLRTPAPRPEARPSG
jgi:ACS family tartrate transporter-like MFS transporter